MSRLSLSTLDRLPGSIQRPSYDVKSVNVGIVHFGPGAFFRAHQAAYIDRLLVRDPRWGLCAVALRSAGVRDALGPQDGLYTLVELDAQTRLRVIGAVRELQVAHETPGEVLARLAAPSVRMVSLTVTEKGYNLTAEGALDQDDPNVSHDLRHPDAPPRTVVAWLAAGLRARHAAGVAPFVTVSCDNLSDNGGKLGRAVAAFARAGGDDRLAEWIEGRARFPRTMVDSITPATDPPLRARVADALGLDDAWPIQREAYCQWVIEDVLGEDAPDLAAVGATLSSDVALFEQAKLRLLNGSHSSLAYLGSLIGLETVAEAMATLPLAGFIERLMDQDIAPTLKAGAGLDLERYQKAVLARFANPSLRHELAQIAWDGSMKLPVRLLGTIEDLLRSGRPLERIALPVAAWMLFVRAQTSGGSALVDPQADALRACVGGSIDQDVARFLALRTVFAPPLAKSEPFGAALREAHAALRANPRDALTR